MVQQILQSEAFWVTVAGLGAWLVQALLTPQVSKLQPTSPIRRAIRLAHGLLNKIDPEGNEK